MFGLCQIFSFVEYVRARMSKEFFEILFKAVLWTVFSAVVIVGVILTITGIVTATLFSNSRLYSHLTNKFFFRKQEKYRHGLADSIRCWIRRMPRITFP